MTSENMFGRGIVAVLRWKRTPEHQQLGYEVTELDRDALVRACAHEGKPNAEVVVCLLQRFAWLWEMEQYRYERLEDLVKAYVQPINPRWLIGGDLHKKRMRILERSGQDGKAADELRRAKRREEYVNQPINTVEGRYTKVVDLVLGGDNWGTVPGAIHYRAGEGTRSSGQDLADDFADDRHGYFTVDSGHGYAAGVNWFFGVGRSKKLVVSCKAMDKPDTAKAEAAKEEATSDEEVERMLNHVSELSDSDVRRLGSQCLMELDDRLTVWTRADA